MKLYAGHDLFGFREWLIYYGTTIPPWPHWLREDDGKTFVACEKLREWFAEMNISYRPDQWDHYYRPGQHTSAIWLAPHHAVLAKITWHDRLPVRNLY